MAHPLLACSGSPSTTIASCLTDPSSLARSPALPNRMPALGCGIPLRQKSSGALASQHTLQPRCESPPELVVQVFGPRGFTRSLARPLIRRQPLALTPSPANCDVPSRGFSAQPMTMSPTSVAPCPLPRHYPVTKRAPQDLAMSPSAKASEYCRRAKRYAFGGSGGSLLVCSAPPLCTAMSCRNLPPCPVPCYPG